MGIQNSSGGNAELKVARQWGDRWGLRWWGGGRRLVGHENASIENFTTFDVEATNQLIQNSTVMSTELKVARQWGDRWGRRWWSGGRRLVGDENASTKNSTTFDFAATNQLIQNSSVVNAELKVARQWGDRLGRRWWGGGRRLVGDENASTENSTTFGFAATNQLIQNSSVLNAELKVARRWGDRWGRRWWGGGRRLVGHVNYSTEKLTTFDLEVTNRPEIDA